MHQMRKTPGPIPSTAKTRKLLIEIINELMKQFSKDELQMTDRHEKVFNMTSHQGHAIKTLNSISPKSEGLPSRNQTTAKERKAKMQGKGSRYALLMVM